MYTDTVTPGIDDNRRMSTYDRAAAVQRTEFEKGSVLEGIVTDVTEGVTIDFGEKTIKFSKEDIKDAKIGQSRSFEVIQYSKSRLVLKEKTETVNTSRGVKSTNIDSKGGALFVLHADKITDKKSDLVYGELEDFMSSEDFSALDDEHESPLEKFNSERLERAIERVKRQRRQREEAIRTQVEKLDIKREQAVFGNQEDARGADELIAERLNKAGLPASEANIERVKEAAEKLSRAAQIDAASKNYIIKNEKEPTIDNLYKALYSSAYIPDGGEEAYTQLKEAVNSVIEQAGLNTDENTIQVAKEFLALEIPVTAENFILRAKLDEISKLDKEDMIDFAINGLQDGKLPEEAVVTKMTAEKAKKAIADFNDVSSEAVEMAAYEAEAKDLVLNLELIKKYNTKLKNSPNEAKEERQNGTSEKSAVTAKRQLEEIRLKLTTESSLRLSALGVEIDTAGLSEIVEGLKNLEKEFYKFILGDECADIDEKADILEKTQAAFETIADAPAWTLGYTFSSNVNITVSELAYEADNASKANDRPTALYDKVLNNYEAVMTKPDREYGDSILKAFNGTDNILASLGFDATEANERAVRILGYNNIEINAENIEMMKYYDASVKQMLTLMTPEVTAQMVRNGVNPVNMTVAEVCESAKKMSDEKISKEEKYSSYLVKLERLGDITDEEKQAYIGIYRLLYQIDKSDGAAIGAVANSGKKFTLANLLEAVRTRKSGGIDADVSDDKILKGGRYTNDILSQINNAYTNNIVDSIINNAEPWKLKDVSETDKENKGSFNASSLMNMPLEELKDELETSDAEVPKSYTDTAFSEFKNVYNMAEMAGDFLINYGIDDSAEFLTAAKELFNGNGASDMLSVLDKKQKDMVYRKDAVESEELPLTETELKEMLDSYFIRASEEVSEEIGDINGGYVSSEDIINYNRMLGGLRLAGELSKKGFYEIPVKTGDTVTNVNLTLIHDNTDTGKINISVQTEKGALNIQADFLKSSVWCLITAENVAVLDEIKGKEDNLNAIFKDEDREVMINYMTDKNAGTLIFKNSTYDVSGEDREYISTDALLKSAADIIGVITE